MTGQCNLDTLVVCSQQMVGSGKNSGFSSHDVNWTTLAEVRTEYDATFRTAVEIQEEEGPVALFVLTPYPDSHDVLHSADKQLNRPSQL